MLSPPLFECLLTKLKEAKLLLVAYTVLFFIVMATSLALDLCSSDCNGEDCRLVLANFYFKFTSEALELLYSLLLCAKGLGDIVDLLRGGVLLL